ncbi:aldehyde dehydrogenase family protein [Streptomyces scabiei]|uniref:aldehyde dehydrogenase family protein n=1 Tax=Streptomyces scabiei TaxID=1930 RepID=UPI001B3136D3|nr:MULTISPECIES: aldehyde dehydrogenase family protein [Streptomyces]MBP5880990.1 aldehyde dehydrogenase family protein [Streptomyces sp. LBUM 1487]MBP5896750.1 aldehyde dehydrogenase family protein [Streptomyces sp. LBUM 1488]MDW8470367.1 aldehyde dehydrogenase family protein [Streptomyces scabiei]MDX2571044.1 aldehyde dehydrogenase family protein [Streptomyces scabiei]MDX2626631.1 aldehyde dehydrogenase family protein [Streptomyces scabiei]
MSATLRTTDPATGRPIAAYDAWDAARIDGAVERGRAAARAWALVPVSERATRVGHLATVLREHREKLARLAVTEMGKPVVEAEAEVSKSALTAEYYAEHGPRILADERVDIDGAEAWIAHEPAGLILAVMPWNFPVWQVMRFAVPSLMAGNGILLKHAPNVTGTALALQNLFADAGFPEHLVTTLLIAETDVPEVTARLIEDDRVAAVTLTGSNRAGAAVGSAAGRAAKKSVLELGGSDAFVVLDDADAEAAAASAVKARFTNCGQSCVCAKRFVVAAPVAAAFTTAFVAAVEALRVGDPRERATQVGPLARDDLRAGIQRQVEESVAVGARLLTGGEPLPGDGYFYRPTVLADTGPGMPAFDEETFGPLAALTVARDDEDAVRLANATAYGLGVSIWTADPGRGVALARRITSGAAFVNAIVASDPRLPFGGTKRSGYGRELAAAGILEFTTTRTYWVART